MTGGAEGKKAAAGEISVRRIEIINAALILLCAAAAYFVFGGERAGGVAMGGLLSAASFRTVALVMRRILRPEPTSGWPVALFWFKYSAVILAVGLLVLEYEVDIIGFLIGVTLIVPSIVIEAVAKAAAREDQKP